MSKNVRLPTPDAPLALEYQQVLLTIPKNADIGRFLWGAVSALAYLTAWDEIGSMTGEEAAAIFKAILMSRTEFSMLGAILPMYTELVPTTMLLCDGSVYNKSDYPDLWALLPSGGKSATTFTVPDLREKFLLGASEDYYVSQVGGSFEVTLTELEMPSHTHGNFPHSHGEIIAIPALGEISPGVPFPSATPSAGTTSPSSITIDNTGGGQAHENMPPFYALRYCIVAKVQP